MSDAGTPIRNDAVGEQTAALRAFARERDWEKFHAPKNLAIAVLVEAAEIAEHFQWSDLAGSALTEAKRREVALEIGDTLLFLLRLADVLGIDPIDAARDKMAINAERYPVDKAYGRSTHHTEL
jgi:NTP pyrophosphatase (non-canonical NTP hydrolase)